LMARVALGRSGVGGLQTQAAIVSLFFFLTAAFLMRRLVRFWGPENGYQKWVLMVAGNHNQRPKKGPEN